LLNTILFYILPQTKNWEFSNDRNTNLQKNDANGKPNRQNE
jgi:hypothetical protein